jgi:hypothetical protein
LGQVYTASYISTTNGDFATIHTALSYIGLWRHHLGRNKSSYWILVFVGVLEVVGRMESNMSGYYILGRGKINA